MYIDVIKNIDGTLSNILPEQFHFSQIEKDENNDYTDDYRIDFETFDNDYYLLAIYGNHDTDIRYYTKYTDRQTYYFNNIPFATVWKDNLDFRVDIIDSLDPNQSKTNTTKYFVYLVDIISGYSTTFLNLYNLTAYCEDHTINGMIYDIEYEIMMKSLII